MTKAKLLKELRALHDSTDVESAHARADELLLEFIGGKIIPEAFEKVPKWYA